MKANGFKVITLDEIAKLKKPVCAFRGCPRFGIYKPVLQLRVDSNSNPLEVELDVVVCGEHSRSQGPENYLSDKGWNILCRNYLPQSGIRPDRKLTTLKFELVI
ncbi:MAG: hypothetical protein V1784_07135 [bacterium]